MSTTCGTNTYICSMPDKLYQDEVFENAEIAAMLTEPAEFDNCTFENCSFASADLSESVFVDCELNDCDLSNVKLNDTGLKGVKFSNCKLLGLLFYDCSKFLFEVHFDNCQLNYSSFFQVKLSGNIFSGCDMMEVDFTEADLTGAVFGDCNLAGARFERSILEKADFRTAVNYSIDPNLNRIKKAKFSLQGVSGLLDAYDIEID